MRKKLTLAQKKKNATTYKAIKKAYKELKNNQGLTYTAYKNRVLAIKQADNLNTKQAIQKLNNSSTFKSASERSRDNLINSIKTRFNDSYKKLTNLNRDARGRFLSVDSLKENMVWDSSRGGYVFVAQNKKKYFIDVKNSPEQVDIYEVS